MKKKLLLIAIAIFTTDISMNAHGGGGGGGHGGHGGGGGYHGGGHGGYGHGGYGHGGYGHGGYGYGRGGYGYGGWGYGGLGLGLGLGLGVGLLASYPSVQYVNYGDDGYPYDYDNGRYENPYYDPNAESNLADEKSRQKELDNQSNFGNNSQHSRSKRIQNLQEQIAELEAMQ